MYSILIKVRSDKYTRWKYYLNEDGSIFVAETIEGVQTKMNELAQEYMLTDLQVVKNFTITEAIDIIED